MDRREFLRRSLLTAAATQLPPIPQTLPLDQNRAATIERWEQLFAQTITQLERVRTIVAASRYASPGKTEAQQLADALLASQIAMDDLCAAVETVRFEEEFEVVTGHPYILFLDLEVWE